MQTTLLSSKGQVIIPKMLRVARHWSAGTRLEVHDTPEGILLKHIAPASKTDLKTGLKAIRQRLAYASPKLSLADMDAAVLQEASKALRKPQTKSPKYWLQDLTLLMLCMPHSGRMVRPSLRLTSNWFSERLRRGCLG